MAPTSIQGDLGCGKIAIKNLADPRPYGLVAHGIAGGVVPANRGRNEAFHPTCLAFSKRRQLT